MSLIHTYSWNDATQKVKFWEKMNHEENIIPIYFLFQGAKFLYFDMRHVMVN